MDPDSSSLKATAKSLRFNATNILKRDLDLSAKNSEDYDSTQLNKSEYAVRGIWFFCRSTSGFPLPHRTLTFRSPPLQLFNTRENGQVDSTVAKPTHLVAHPVRMMLQVA